MAFVDRTKDHGDGIAAIAAAPVRTAHARASAVPGWAHAPPTASPVEACPSVGGVQCCGFPPGQDFLRDNRVCTTLDAPDGLSTIPANINTRGQMVSIYTEVERPPPDEFFNGFSPGFLRDDGVLTSIDTPGPSETGLCGINTCGQTVGAGVDADGTLHRFLLDHKTFTPLDIPSSTFTQISGINDAGQSVGISTDDMQRHGLLLHNGVIAIRRVPGVFQDACALAIDDHGQIVGSYF